MGRGKKKDKQPKSGDDQPPPEEPSTSQTAPVVEPPIQETKTPKPQEKKEEEDDGLGLGLGGPKKNKSRKKKPASQAQAASAQPAPAQPTPVLPSPVQLGPGWPQQAPPPGLPSPGWAQQGPPPGQPSPGWTQQGPPPGHPGPGRPQQGPPPGHPGPGRPQQGPPPGHPGPGRPQQGPPPGWSQPGPPMGQPGPPPGWSQPGPPPGPQPPQQRQDWRQPPQGIPQAAQLPVQQSMPEMSTLSIADQSAGRGRGRGQGRPQGLGRGQVSQPPAPVQAQPTSSSMSAPALVPQSAPSRAEQSSRYKIPDKIVGRRVRTMAIKVLANYLPMTFKPIKVYRYDVTFRPDRPKKMLKEAYKKVIDANYRNDFIAFDQAKNIYCFAPLKNVPKDGRLDFTVELKDPNGKLMSFEVSFKSTGIVDLGKIKLHMDAGGSSLSTPSEEIQCIDVILRQGALDSYVKAGRQFFKRPNNPIDLGGGLEMWTGLFQSAIFTSHAFINVDVAHKGFPKAQSVIATMVNCFNLKTDSPIESQRSYEIENFKTFIKGLRVTARMVDGQTREFITNSIIGPPKDTFFLVTKDNKDRKVSVFDYFTKEKGFKLRYPNLNCAWVGPKEKNIYYPLELLDIVYGQPLNRQLNERQLSTMVKEAATPPDVRKRKIEEVTRAMNYPGSAFFKKFGLEISDRFLEVNAKLLEPPALDVGEARSAFPRRGQWNAQRLQKPERLLKWGMVSVDCQVDPGTFDNLRQLVLNTGHQMGMSIEEPRIIECRKRLNELRNFMYKAVDMGVNFLFIVISGFSKDAYHRVKQLAEMDVGLVTQCIKDNTVNRRMNQQTMRNILLKVNSKLMGVNQKLDARSIPPCLDNTTMVVGADVTHPSPDQSNIPSIAAVTASMDPTCFRYNIEMSVQTPKKEMIVQFEDMMFDHFKVFHKTNKYLPKKIYVFRDGVSEGQFAEVMSSELSAIHRAYARLSRTTKPEVLFLLVQKRHHTRFFLGANSMNVEPGTVVDTHIVHPKELDFYLVSHQAIKGTARPTRYHAVCNDSKIPDDEVEQLTFYLCHLYSRCMRSVSYPSPTYYAHLACLRARSLTYGQTFDNRELERQPQRLRVMEKMLELSRMFFV